MEMLLSIFVIYFGCFMTSAAVITLFMIFDVMITDRQYPPGTGVGIVVLAAMIGALLTVAWLTSAYVMLAAAGDTLYGLLTVVY